MAVASITRRRLREKDKNLVDRSQRYWSDLDVGFTTFDSRDQIATQIENIDKDQLIAFYDHLLDLERRQRLVIYSRGKFEDAPPGTPISNIAAFRQTAGPVTPTDGPASAIAH